MTFRSVSCWTLLKIEGVLCCEDVCVKYILLHCLCFKGGVSGCYFRPNEFSWVYPLDCLVVIYGGKIVSLVFCLVLKGESNNICVISLPFRGFSE